MLFPILQDLDAAAASMAGLSADSLKVKAAETIETLKDTEPSVLLQNLTEQALHFGLKVLAALLIYIIGGWIIKKIKKIIARSLERKGSDPTLRTFVNSLVSITLWIILIILTIGALGINTSSLAALLAAGGLAIGMAFSGTVQNFAGGVMILVFKPFKAGDFIEAQGFTGTVAEVNITCTKLITLDNRVIIIPNGALSNGNINNISALPLRRVDWTVNIAYGSNYDSAKEAILSFLKSNPKVLDSSTEGAADPFVALLALNESTIQLVIRAWVKSPDYWDVNFWFNETVYSKLPGKDVRFAFPQINVHIDGKN